MTGLVIEGVSHAYAVQPVLREVSLAVAPGEVVCLLGPSGCGKTTLLRLAAGLETVQSGRIVIDGRVVAEGGGPQLPPERRGVGLMFQDYALFPHLTIRQNIAFGIAGNGHPDRARWTRVAIRRVRLRDFADAYPHTLSGGQQQRVALLRALAPSPRVLLLDEPFSGLDVTLRAQVREDTLALLKETGIATLIVTHDPEEAMFMADRILVMEDGAIVQAGSPRETYLNPVNAFVVKLFGPVNRLSGRVEAGHVATPLGTFPAPGLADGRPAHVYLRPESLRLDGPDGPGTAATVVSARLLGRASHVRVATLGAEGVGVTVTALVPGPFAAAAGSVVRVAVDPGQAFVFQAD